MPLVKVLKPSASTLASALFKFKPGRIGYLRTDALAQLLVQGNVQSGITIAVVDNCGGLLVGAVAERVGGRGHVIELYEGPHPSIKIAEMFNFSPETLRSIHHFPLKDLPLALSQENSESISEVPPEGYTPTPLGRNPSQWELNQTAQLLRKKVDSLIVFSRFSPPEVFFPLFEALGPSRPFAMYSPYPQSLAECYHRLLVSGEALNLDLTETWMREYQVLPGRTHPLMTMKNASGFILSGVKIIKDED